MVDDPSVRARQVGPRMVSSLDHVWARFRARLDGLAQDEYRWEPVPGCWTVRPAGDGRWQADQAHPDPEPAPVTTIAWRLWHIASDCLASYTRGGLGDWPLDVHDREWYPDVTDALAAADRSWAAFRDGLVGLGEDGLWRPMGERWGQYATEPWLGLALHAQDELSHHGAEVALLRDLYPHRHRLAG